MKTPAISALAAVLAFGTPAALAQESPDTAGSEARVVYASAPAQSPVQTVSRESARPADQIPHAESAQRDEQIPQPESDQRAEQIAQPESAQRAEQILYKGVVGNLLEAVPMDAETRVELQRGNALVSAPFSARSIALLLGITNPVVMIGGLVWGIWAASRIEAPVKNAEEPARERVHVAAEAFSAD